MEPNNLCMVFENVNSPGLAEIKLRSCGDNPNQICDIFGGFAWTQAALVSTVPIINPRSSPVYGKKTEVKCKDRNDLIETNLNNGRKCLEGY